MKICLEGAEFFHADRQSGYTDMMKAKQSLFAVLRQRQKFGKSRRIRKLLDITEVNNCFRFVPLRT
jgi:hypothetical protein